LLSYNLFIRFVDKKKESMNNENDDVDCDLRRCQNMMLEAYANLPSFDPWSVDDLRRVTAIVRAPWTEGGPVMKRTEEKYVGDYSTRIRFYYPTDEQKILPALIYIHGGGWTIFSSGLMELSIGKLFHFQQKWITPTKLCIHSRNGKVYKTVTVRSENEQKNILLYKRELDKVFLLEV